MTKTKAAGFAGANPAQHAKAAVEALREVSRAVQAVAKERTRQAEIRAESEAELARIAAQRDVILSYLDRSFDERRTNFDELFRRIDRGIEEGRLEVVAASLDALVKLADSSPFKALGDLSKVKAIPKGTKWEF